MVFCLVSHLLVPEEAKEKAPKKGVKTKMIGVGFIFVGLLNIMLAWRGAFEVHNLQIVILIAGVFLYVIGAIRGGES
ncbi:MAG TPA: hypothetical protein ENI79_03165 [Rhodospirillales bacterium]|nr:hypothetical protein [Rhodospirillales bacterium]